MYGEDLSDANLFRRVRRNDPRAFGVLLRRHDRALRQLATRLLAEDGRVDPILHKAYTKAWRSASVAGLGNAKGEAVLNWLYRLVYNACVDELRRQSPQSGPEPPTGPRVRLPKASEERRMAALRALLPSERIPLVLIDSEGFTVEAAARILQRPPSRVASDLERARCRWRDLVIGPPVAAPPPASPTVAGESEPADDEKSELPRGEQPQEPEKPKHAARPKEPAGPDGPAEEDGARAQQPAEAGTGNGSKPRKPKAKPEAPKERKTPDIDDPDEVVYAAEGVFDTERFSNLKQWFKDGRRQGTPAQ